MTMKTRRISSYIQGWSNKKAYDYIVPKYKSVCNSRGWRFCTRRLFGISMSLGLASVYCIVKAQGGYIDIYSITGMVPPSRSISLHPKRQLLKRKRCPQNSLSWKQDGVCWVTSAWFLTFLFRFWMRRNMAVQKNNIRISNMLCICFF